MKSNFTIASLLEQNNHQQPDQYAIFGTDGQPANYRQIYEQIQYTIKFLNAKGIGRNDPVAIVLPNGPLMASAFLSIASGATSAPLNPAYTKVEYEFFLKDLNAKAVLIEKDSDSPVIEVANNLSIPIFHLIPDEDETAGLFTLKSSKTSASVSSSGIASPTDIALILHTSGTTSKPKMVPLTQKNLWTSAKNIAHTLALTSQDRCLNIMPLFHIHGLMAAVTASIAAGGSIVCTPGFYAPRFFDWLDNYKPSYYTAVPTMHQAILSRAKDHLEIINRCALRFIRSSSSSLPPNVMAEIEDIFGVPVIEAYGMTEASHQIASNPLPPGRRKPGSVGLPAGPEFAIMDESYITLLPEKTFGEIVIRGENVTLGYLNNPEANVQSFPKGWFRTGDQGFIDEDGYLFITGRLKEIINRGGEKISPREVDEVILKHSGVAQVVTFSMPHKELGEDIAAAVILKDKTIDANDIRRFAAEKLAPHKVPAQIIILDEIPKGPTGKLQRIGLAEKLGLKDHQTPEQPQKRTYEAPQTEIQKTIAEIWMHVLDVKIVGLYDPFRNLGGDSMLATLVHQELESIFSIGISLVDLYKADTVEKQAAMISELIND